MNTLTEVVSNWRYQNAEVFSKKVIMNMLSVVVPAHNEESNVGVIFKEIKVCLNGINEEFDWELIFVDDGSIDNTIREVQALMNASPKVRLVQLSRNFGHQAALMAGLMAAHGDAVISMDCDLQHPPRYIPEMIGMWNDGALVVEMRRKRTEGISFVKHLFSVSFYKIINKLSSVPIREGVSDFRLIDRIVVDELIKINDPKPFIRGLIAWLGFNSNTIDYVAEERRYGMPSYNFKKSLHLARHALMSLSHEPLRLSVYASMLLFFLCVVYLVYVVTATLLGGVVPGWPSVIIAILVLGAIQMMSLGIIGEYIAQIFERSRNLPPFVALPECDIYSKGNSEQGQRRPTDF